MGTSNGQWNADAEPLELESGNEHIRLSNSVNSAGFHADDEEWHRKVLNRPGYRKALWIGLLSLACASSFIVGRASKAASTNVIADCESNSASWENSVAPEGRVSGNFDALYDYRGHPRMVKTTNGGMVAADHGRCSDIGADILRKGGNVVDAGIATALCQGVMNPMASGVGGGHFMLIRQSNGDSEVIDARELAPLAANESMFVGRPSASVVGGLAIAVPLELKGLKAAHERHGKLPWADLFQPAIKLAEKGFAAHPYLVSAVTGTLTSKTLAKASPELQSTFLVRDKGGWRPPKINETCCARPKLAALLRDVAEQGPDVLYKGKYAKGLVADIQAAGGIITLDDLNQADVEIKSALKGNTMGVDVLLAPPPSSAATVFTALNVLSEYDLPLAGAGSLGVHRLVESMKHAFALRMSLGDPGPNTDDPFVNVNDILNDMLSDSYALQLKAMLKDDAVLNQSSYGGKWNILNSGAHRDDHGTSHLCVVDGNKMAVSMTTTINTGFGSLVMSKSTGILLNNQMDDFSTPDQPNIYGIYPSPSNFIRPGKKPFSSMSPIIVEQQGALRLIIGASGGPRIISGVLQTLLRVLSYGEDTFSAVAGPRLHHQLVPNTLGVEYWDVGGLAFHFDNSTAAELAERGHQVEPTNWGAVVQAIEVEMNGEIKAVCDPRKDGAPSAE